MMRLNYCCLLVMAFVIGRLNCCDSLQVASPIMGRAVMQLKRPRSILYANDGSLGDSGDEGRSNVEGGGRGNQESQKQQSAITKALSSFIVFLWRGMTLPFPALRSIVPSDLSATGGAFSIRESLLAIFSYLLVGGVAYTRVFEKWSLVDALYFSVVCFSTVGYGDLVPTNPKSKLFTCFFGLGGVAFLGIALATLGTTLVKAELEAVQRASHKISRKRLFKIFDGMPHVLSRARKSKSEKKKIKKKRQKEIKKHFHISVPHWSKQFIKFTPKFLPSFALLGVAGATMARLEGWRPMNAMYYVLITAGTIGLGDYAPQTRAGRLFGIALIPISVAAAGEFLGNLANLVVERRERLQKQQMLNRKLDFDYLMSMDISDSGDVARWEFIQFMLLEMGVVEQELFDKLHEQFDYLDADNNGTLQVEDLKLMAELSGVEIGKK